MKSKRKAATWEEEEQKKLLEESQTGTEYLTIQEWMDEYLDDVQRRKLSKKTYKEKVSTFSRFVELSDLAPNLDVGNIDRFLVKRFLDGMIDMGRSGYAVNKDRKNLGAAWKWGQENIQNWPEVQNPVHMLPKYPEQRLPRYIPSDEDFWKFTDYLKDQAKSGEPSAVQDYTMHLVFLYLAARRGEVFRLKRNDLDFDQNRIRLWTRKRKGGQLEYDWLPMPSELRSNLIQWCKIRMGFNFETDHVFACLEQTPFCLDYYLQPFTVRQHFMARVCEAVKIKPFGYHAIRHFSASQLFASGYSVNVIQTILRHQSPNTTTIYLRKMGFDPAVKQALEKGIVRPGKVINLDEKRAAN